MWTTVERKKRSVTWKTIKTFPHFSSIQLFLFAPSACLGRRTKVYCNKEEEKRVSQQCVDVELGLTHQTHSTREEGKHTPEKQQKEKHQAKSVSEYNKVINGNDLFWVHLLSALPRLLQAHTSTPSQLRIEIYVLQQH